MKKWKVTIKSGIDGSTREEIVEAMNEFKATQVCGPLLATGPFSIASVEEVIEECSCEENEACINCPIAETKEEETESGETSEDSSEKVESSGEAEGEEATTEVESGEGEEVAGEESPPEDDPVARGEAEVDVKPEGPKETELVEEVIEEVKEEIEEATPAEDDTSEEEFPPEDVGEIIEPVTKIKKTKKAKKAKKKK